MDFLKTWGLDTINGWIIFGLAGQICFSMRFLLQWLHSERKKKSVVPVSFWYFSLVGSMILLVYAIYRKDIVFMLGQAFGLFVYTRNLALIARHRNGVTA